MNLHTGLNCYSVRNYEQLDAEEQAKIVVLSADEIKFDSLHALDGRFGVYLVMTVTLYHHESDFLGEGSPIPDPRGATLF